MVDSGRDERSWVVGDIENGHFLTASGWVPIRKRSAESGPEHGGPPWQVGDSTNGHVFSGQGWVPLPQRPPAPGPPPMPQALVSPQSTATPPNWFMRQTVGKRVAMIVAIPLVVIVAGPLSAAFEPDPAGPEKQAEFLSIVVDGQNTETDNDTQVVSAKRTRGNRLCDLLPSTLMVERWTGTLDSVTTELGGDEGLLKITIGDGVDIVGGDIDPDSAVFDQIAGLSEGAQVTFNGRFKASGAECIYESSLGSANGLRTPDFQIELSSIG